MYLSSFLCGAIGWYAANGNAAAVLVTGYYI